ncbi:MAG TPA: type II secretion system protein [Planctomycetota bacterium]|nr:type II secretion system protein [Planctomycetota bacterium]
MGRRRRPRARSGFTLLELVFALSVLSFALVSAFASQLGSLDLIRASRETSIASADMQAAFERVYTLQKDDLPQPGSEFEAGQPVAAFEGLHLQDQRVVATYPTWAGGMAAVPDPLEVVLTMTWSDFDGRERRLVMGTMVTQ